MMVHHCEPLAMVKLKLALAKNFVRPSKMMQLLLFVHP